MKCSRCGEHSATSPGTTLCSACMYEDAMGKERAARQRELAAKDRDRDKGKGKR